MPLDKEVSLGPGDIVLDGDRALPRERGTAGALLFFGPCLLWPWSLISGTAELMYKDNIHQHISKTAHITKDDITSQHSNTLAMCCEVIYSFVILASLDMRVGRCHP